MKKAYFILAFISFVTSSILFIAGCCSEKQASTNNSQTVPQEIHEFYCDSTVFPGDAILVKLTTTKIGTLQAKAVFHKTGKEKILSQGELYFLKTENNRIKNMQVLLPLSTWIIQGDGIVELDWSLNGIKQEKQLFNVTVLTKNFTSETIELNAQNTTIRTSQDEVKKQQIQKLWNLFNTTQNWTEKECSDFPRFEYPVKATRRTSFFGDRRLFKYSNGKTDTSEHYGIDYGIPVGTEVYSVCDGIVVMAENRISTGGTVIVEAAPGLYSLFYHLDSYNVKAGEHVSKGQLVAKSGQTGLATGPHLHWEMRLYSVPVNPDYFVEKFN